MRKAQRGGFKRATFCGEVVSCRCALPRGLGCLEIGEGTRTLSSRDKLVILNAGEAGAKDRTADDTIDTVSGVASAACWVVEPSTSSALSAVGRSFIRLGAEFRMTRCYRAIGHYVLWIMVSSPQIDSRVQSQPCLQ